MQSRKFCFIIAAMLCGFAPAAMAAAANKAAAAKPAGDKITAAAKAKPAQTAAEAQRGVLNGYKGYHYRRPGYKSAGDGWWYPRAAFPPKSSKTFLLRRPAAWAKTGRAAGGEPPAAARRQIYAAFGLSAAHHRWCAARFPSYNPADNIYAAAGGRKRVCLSPYLEKEPLKK